MASFNTGYIKRYNGSAWETMYPKNRAEDIISGTLATARIPNLSADKITSGVLADAIIPNLAASKITSGAFDVDRIPTMSADKIMSGVFGTARIPDLNASKITEGTLSSARIPNLDASKITTGTINASLLPAIAVTNTITATTLAAFIALYSSGAPTPADVAQEGDIVILTTDNETYIHNGGSAGTAADFTKLQTPTDVVTSVAGKTGVVTLAITDITDLSTQLGNKVETLADLGITAVDASELDLLDGLTVGATKINFLANVISDVQNQIDAKARLYWSTTDPAVAAAGDYAFVYSAI
jgi:hypothetical protein